MGDRCYYRSSSDRRLIEEARDNPNQELCIALGERLQDVLAEMDERIAEQRDRAEDFKRDANKLDDKVYDLQREIDSLHLMLGQREDYILELEAKLKEGTC